MSSVFYPVLPFSCPWGAWGSCRFCGIPFMERVLVPEMPKQEELFSQFDSFVENPKNLKDIQRHKRVAIAPNGSVVPEVPRNLRDYVFSFCQQRGLRFESELIATLIDKKRTFMLYERAYRVKFRSLTAVELERKVTETIEDIEQALNRDFPDKNVLLNAGLEVADSDDLQKLHKYTTDLEDFIAYADYLRKRNILVGANVLVGAPMVDDPIRKALQTIRFAFERMRADKILLITWNPVNHTVAKKLYDRGEVDVISATEAAEIYRVARRAYPEKEIEFNAMRAYIYHGKHPNFRSARINTDERKAKARENVRSIAKEVFAN